MEVFGKITSAAASKGMYERGDEVWVNLRAYAIYQPDHDWSGWWNTYYEVTSVTGKVLGSAVRNHTIAPWTSEDRADDSLSINCGRFNNSDILTVKLVFDSIGLPWSTEKALDQRKVQVWVRELAVPEPPVSTPTPVIPIPIAGPVRPPEWGPDMVPVPVPGPGDEEPEPVPDGEMSWLWIGVAALGLVLLAPKRKATKG